MNQHPTAAQRYNEGLVEALRTRDPAVFAQFLVNSGRGTPEFSKDPRRLEEAMHRFTITFPDLSEYHEESRHWLAEHASSPLR